MKKLIYGTLFLAVVGIGFVACEKEEVEQNKSIQNLNSTSENDQNDGLKKAEIPTDDNDYSGISVEEGVLSFNSLEYYESFFTNHEAYSEMYLQEYISTLPFDSYLKLNKENNLYEDELVASIININQIVKIGDWFIKLDAKNEKVFAINSNLTDSYSAILDVTIYNRIENVLAFDFEDEVVELLKEGGQLNDRWGCSARKALSEQVFAGSKYMESVNGVQTYNNLRVKYHKYGVYFSLKATGWRTNLGGFGHYHDAWFQLESCDYRERCGAYISNYSHPWRNPNAPTSGGIDLEETFKFYNGTRQLKNYDFKVRYRIESTYNQSSGYNVYFSDWAHINDY